MFAKNSLGVAALENGEMSGFLCCYDPWEGAFNTESAGAFSPIHAVALKRRSVTYED